MKTIPADFDLLKEIYTRYYDEYKGYRHTRLERETKNYVPIDIEAISQHFGTDPDIVFGRLHYHFNVKYGITNSDGSTVPFFAKVVSRDKNAINFPQLASVLAGMREERNRQNIAMYLSVAAITISTLTFILNGFKTLHEAPHASQQQTQVTLENQKPLEPTSKKK